MAFRDFHGEISAKVARFWDANMIALLPQNPLAHRVLGISGGFGNHDVAAFYFIRENGNSLHQNYIAPVVERGQHGRA